MINWDKIHTERIIAAIYIPAATKKTMIPSIKILVLSPLTSWVMWIMWIKTRIPRNTAAIPRRTTEITVSHAN
jgi:hypothetical protein